MLKLASKIHSSNSSITTNSRKELTMTKSLLLFITGYFGLSIGGSGFGGVVNERPTNKPACVEAFEKPHFGGRSWRFGCQETNDHAQWNDRIRSIKTNGYRVTLCTELSQGTGKGICRTFISDSPKLDWNMLNHVSWLSWSKMPSDDFTIAISSGYQKSLRTVISGAGGRFRGLITNGNLAEIGHQEELNAFEDTWVENQTFSIWPGLGSLQSRAENKCDDKSCILGAVEWFENHVGSMPTRSFDAEVQKSGRFRRHKKTISGSLAYSWDIGDFHFVQLNSHPEYKTTISDSQYIGGLGGWFGSKYFQRVAEIKSSLGWLKADLRQTKKPYIIINMQDLDQSVNSPGFKKILDQDKRIKAIFATNNTASNDFSFLADIGARSVPVFKSGSPDSNSYLWVRLQSQQGITVNSINSQYGQVKITESYTIKLDGE